MPKPIQWIKDAEAVNAMSKILATQKAIAFDTEFIRETTFFPKIALMQVATLDEAWLIDPLALSAADLDPFFSVLKDPDILKILHAAYADQECLYWGYGFSASPVLDTGVAGALCGYGDNVGLGKLLKEVLDLSLPKGRARVKWLARPLSAELLAYAEQDVAHLVRLGTRLSEKLERQGRLEWAMDESCLDSSVFEVSPEDMAKRIAKNGLIDGTTLGVLTELLRWREGRARKANLPRGWISENDILVSLAKVRPTTIEDLRSFRGLNVKEVERSGNAILEAIQTGLGHPIAPPAIHRPKPSEREDHLFDFIRTYTSFLADRHGIALRFLINSSKATSLVAHSNASLEEWVAEGILSENACRLVGTDLQALLAGHRGLILRNGKVEILEV